MNIEFKRDERGVFSDLEAVIENGKVNIYIGDHWVAHGFELDKEQVGSLIEFLQQAYEVI